VHQPGGGGPWQLADSGAGLALEPDGRANAWPCHETRWRWARPCGGLQHRPAPRASSGVVTIPQTISRGTHGLQLNTRCSALPLCCRTKAGLPHNAAAHYMLAANYASLARRALAAQPACRFPKREDFVRAQASGLAAGPPPDRRFFARDPETSTDPAGIGAPASGSPLRPKRA